MKKNTLFTYAGKTYEIDVFSGDADKFIVNFNAAWGRLPEDVRENIAKYWLDIPCVRFELSNFWRDHEKTLAKAGICGTELKFNSDKFDKMTPEPAQYTIAHELAHVYQYSAKLVTPGKEFNYEDNANDLACKWGFDHIAQMIWRAESILGNKK